MSVSVLYQITQSKIAPKDFNCSGCGIVVKRGRVYTKTNSGRYCGDCADKMEEKQ